MTLSAFTNQPGTHSHYDWREERERGIWFGSIIDEVDQAYTLETERSVKPWPIQGDFVHALNYSRHVSQVTRDEPFVEHATLYAGSELKGDLYTDRFISKQHTPFVFVPPFPNEGNAKSETITKALLRLQGEHSSLGSALADGRRTVNMLASKASDLAKALAALRRGNLLAALRQLGISRRGAIRARGRDLSAAWLEYQYGWKPFVQDIHDTALVVMTSIGEGIIIYGHASASSEDAGTLDHGGRDWAWACKSSHRTKISALVQNKYIVDANRLGLINPASVAWELTPWSFLIDWFMPIGQVLEACTVPMGVLPLGGYTSTHRDWKLSATQRVTDFDGYGGVSASGHYEESHFSFFRNAFSSFPLPEFYVRENPYKTTRALNAIALMRQLR